MRDKENIEDKKQQLITLTSDFCNKYIDEEFRNLCEKMILKMSRKRNVPFMTGKIEIWAAAIIYSLGQINFLFDKSFEPYITATDICDFFGRSQSTVSQKAKLIRDIFKMGYFDDAFSTNRVRENNPLANMVMLKSGLIVDIDSLTEIMNREICIGDGNHLDYDQEDKIVRKKSKRKIEELNKKNNSQKSLNDY